MTGSGKSEFIISYVLSLAVNYHPDELSFILIDYKGGGVAGAFENKETGMSLPHIAGTITNLDTVEMKRSLVSIESELRRRQRIFNEARNKTNESTIDIYKYQKLYREGLVTEPISHLLIICDEFAELKVQQPDFMDQLISTARIGRSLGVHLILATQKPSGVVDDQIWSNSRFRICLKVQEKSDSMDMLKSPDAAMIKDVGRFYLQVGYNEFYALGQSAWCGGQYIPTDKFKKKVDNSVVFVDNMGNTIKSVDDSKKIMTNNVGQELTNVVKYLSDISKEQNIKIKRLWLDRIPDLIYVDDLKKKYNYIPQPFNINPIVGEYDDPGNQRQDLLTLNLSNNENTIIYGSSGSGETIFLSSIIYSSITDHSPEEINYYIMDFGSEMLKIFSNAPQVGDVLLINDNEKIDNLFKLLKSEIEKRKKIFVNYNGDFNFYNKKSENKMPLLVVVVNNYEAFSENYQDYEEMLIQITRDGSRYGIIFVITTSGTNSIRYRMKQNFKQEFVLQMNDDSDYSSVFGNVGGVYPSKSIGRGLIKKDKVYEFQSAHPYNPDKMSEYIVGVCNKLKEEANNTANRIAVLPEVVKKKDINSKNMRLSDIPVGIDKDTLKISNWDFEENYGTIVTGADFDSIDFFVEPLIRQFENIGSSVFVLDSYEALETEFYGNIMYINKDFNKIIHSLHESLKSQYDAYVNSNYNKEILANVKPAICVIIGVDSLTNRLSEEAKVEYSNIIKYGEAVQTIKFIFVDSIDIFKKIEYNDWCKIALKTNQGIWLGNGIREQYTLKLARLTKSMQQDLEKDFGYVIRKGNAYLTKFLSSLEEE
jgi:S-DNA-T family DNA segregation ATPase FtsK/SpoIIIE